MSQSVARSHHPIHPVLHHDPQSAARALAFAEAAQRAEKRQRSERRAHLYVGGRILLAALFITSAFAKLEQFSATREAMIRFGFASATLLLSTAIVVELICGVMLALGYRARGAALGLIAYLCVVTFAVHGDLRLDINRSFAVANLALCGGLLMVVGHGAGSLSLDKRVERIVTQTQEDSEH